ncbi:hypothetical protein HY485_02425 [Candidatus Woesearchaeota archaeon]|nr:hypothetical protein [Candidatus Woesearchaeota archaeon]
MPRKVVCPWGCGKRIKHLGSHKRVCHVRTGAEHSAVHHVEHSAEVSAEHDAVHQSTPSINSTKDASLSGETHTFQELASEWNKVKEELKVSGDELLPQKLQKTAENTGITASAVDGAQFKSYEVLANSLHQSVNDLIIFATKGKLRMQKEQLDRLNECGSQVLHKYDKSGKIAQYVPELAYVLTLTDVVAQVLLVMKKDEVRNGGAKNDSGAVGREGQANQGIAGTS